MCIHFGSHLLALDVSGMELTPWGPTPVLWHWLSVIFFEMFLGPLLGADTDEITLAVTDSQRERGGQSGVLLQKAGHFQQPHRAG